MVAADDRTPLIFSLSPGQARDAPEGRKLLRRMGPPEGVPDILMDWAYRETQRANRRRNWDTRRWFRRKRTVPIPGSTIRRCTGRRLYRRRNEVERLFRRLKGFRRVFTRYDKLDALYLGFILFAIIFDALRSVNTP